MLNNFLSFSDGAKFALVAKNIFEGQGFTTTFSFWGNPLFATNGIPYLVPYLMSIFFKIFGATDFGVKAFSTFFFILLIISVFLLGRKLFNNVAGILAALTIGFNHDFINYSQSGASETLFAFEIVFGVYLLSFKKLWVNILGFVVVIAMYFSKPQAFIFMAGMILFWLINRFDLKRGVFYFFGATIIGLFILPLTPIIGRGMQSILTYSPNSAVSDALRGAPSSTLGLNDILKKVFYNLYNFYKLMPQILNPYLFALFIIGIFKKESNKLINTFKISSVFLLLITLLVTALTIPFFRYIHPAVPLIYLLAIGTLVSLFTNKIIVTSLVLFFAVGQTMGILFLDSRFEKNIHNFNKPPVYVVLAEKLKEDTKNSEIIVTNLDTWGSWYGSRKTVWFPLEPKMLEGGSFDAIYLTDYKIDDKNYYMGKLWREIFENPEKQKILTDYKFAKEYKINASENYEREDARAVLLIKK